MVAYYRLNEFGFRLAAGARVVKAESFAPIDRAAELLAAAEAKAAQIVADAEEAREQERRRGYEEGLQQAAAAAAERLLHESAELDARLRALDKDITALVIACARKLIDGFDEVARAEAVVTAALKTMRREKRAELRAPPQLYAHFRENIRRIAADFPEVELIDVVEDASLAPTHLVLETSIGRVDADLGKHVGDLELALRDAHGRAAADHPGGAK